MIDLSKFPRLLDYEKNITSNKRWIPLFLLGASMILYPAVNFLRTGELPGHEFLVAIVGVFTASAGIVKYLNGVANQRRAILHDYRAELMKLPVSTLKHAYECRLELRSDEVWFIKNILDKTAPGWSHGLADKMERKIHPSSDSNCRA